LLFKENISFVDVDVDVDVVLFLVVFSRVIFSCFFIIISTKCIHIFDFVVQRRRKKKEKFLLHLS